MSSATSGYTVFTGEVQHACSCSSTSNSPSPSPSRTRSSGDDDSTSTAVEASGAASEAISTNQGMSSLSHLLDGNNQTYWCSLPHDLYKMAGTCALSFMPDCVIQPLSLERRVRLRQAQ